MDSLLQRWLIERLGANCVSTRKDLCKTMADGTLLAQLLHSYGLIGVEEKDMIQNTEDPWTRLENLNYLMSYLKAIKVRIDEYVLVKISKEEESPAIKLLYKLYAKLEPNSTLRLEVEQKESEVTGRYPPRFTVCKVHASDATSRAMTSVNPLITPLKAKSNIIAWHRAKYEQMLDTLRQNKARIAERIRKSIVKVEGGDSRCKHMFEGIRRDMNQFAEMYKDEEERDTPISQLMAEQVKGEYLSKEVQLGIRNVRDYLPYLRGKIKRDKIHRKIKKSIEKVLLSEAMEKLTKEQESEFDLLITKKLMKQSQYEKQILSKLHDIRDEKTRIIKNRNFVQNLIFKENEIEADCTWIDEATASSEAFQNKERGKLIVLDYHKKIEEEKIRLKKEKCTRICSDAVSDIIDIAIKKSEFTIENDVPVPQKMWDEWKVLFINSQPIFDILENIEDILEPGGDEDFEAKRELEIERQRILDEADFEAYMELKGPWLLEDLCPELGILLEPQNILGYIVYRALDSKYPTRPEYVIDLPPAKVAAVLIGLDDEEILAMLQSLLDMHQVQILHVNQVIEYFISAYQEELSKVGSVDANLIIATERTKAELAGRKFEVTKKADDASDKSRPASRSSKDSSTTADTSGSEKKEKKSKKDKDQKDKKKGKGGKETGKKPKTLQLEDKEVQVPDEEIKMQLTQDASLGKSAFEILAIGEKIGDDLLTKMLLEYIKNKEFLGWVLVNYPENYSQAKLLEEALVGISLPPEKEVIESLEALGDVIAREVEEKKPMRKTGCSRLVPNTFGTTSCEFPKPYLTAYITLERNTLSEEDTEETSEDVNWEYSVSDRKSGALGEVKERKSSDGEKVSQGAKATVSIIQTAEELKKSKAGSSKSAIVTKASKISADKALSNQLQRSSSVRWKDEGGNDMMAETAEEIGDQLDLGGLTGEELETTEEGDVIGQEIKEPEGLCPLDKFYLNQGVSFKFYYEDFDLQTLKNLARLIIGDSDDINKGSTELFGPVLEELEEYLTKKAEGKQLSWNAKRVVTPQAIAKAKEKAKKELEMKLESSEGKDESIPETKPKDESSKKDKKKDKKDKKDKKGKKKGTSAGSEQTTETASEIESPKAVEELQEPQPEPGQEEAQYMSFEIPQELLVTLATIWENLEEVYIKDFKEAFFMKRVYEAAIFPYAAFVKNAVTKLMQGTDNKQIFVHDFQMQFNAIDEDLRSDIEMKSELHARVYELRMALYDIADNHKFEVEAERQRIIKTNWVTEHMAAITNIFLLTIQLEADRFVDTIQIIQDYYMGMLDVHPTDITLEKVMVTRLELASPTTPPPEFDSEESLDELLRGPSVEDSTLFAGETKSDTPVSVIFQDKISNSDKTSVSEGKETLCETKPDTGTEIPPVDRLEEESKSEAETKSISAVKVSASVQQVVSSYSIKQESSENILKKFIENLLVYVEEDSESDSVLESPFHSVINDTLGKVSSVIDEYTHNQQDSIARQESSLGKKDKKGKKWTDRDTSSEAEQKKAKMSELRAMSEKFFEEWKTALNTEAERAKARLQLILKRAFQDIDEIFRWAKSLFHGLHQDIATRYNGEIAAIDELCKVLCNAIEDEQRIQEQLVIDGDDFFTRPYILMFPRPTPEEPLPVEEPFRETTFRVEQLRRLLDIFRIIAPSGLMPERAMCYILEDLIMCRSEGHELPPRWYHLTSLEVPALLEAIYGKAEYVEWREFIIRALSLGYPSMKQVLRMREEFKKYDVDLKEHVTLDAYNDITLWFEKNVLEDEVTQLHIRLAKELLLDMFQTPDSEFGYMTFLLNFCKDEDPKHGMAKAFALNSGRPIVATEDEFKEYTRLMEEEEQRRQKELEEATDVAKDIIWDVTDDAVQTVSGIIVKEIVEEVQEKLENVEEQKETIREIIDNIEQNSAESEEQHGESELEIDESTEILFKNSATSGSSEEELSYVLSAAVAIPAEVIVNVLTASLPWHGKTETVMDAGEKSLLMQLDLVCEELGDENKCVVVHEFLSHKFISNLFNDTYKFHAFTLEDKVERVFITHEYLDRLCDHVTELVK